MFSNYMSLKEKSFLSSGRVNSGLRQTSLPLHYDVASFQWMLVMRHS